MLLLHTFLLLWCSTTVRFSYYFRINTFILFLVEGVNATPYEDNMRYFNVAIAGPVGTCYEGKYVTIYTISLSHILSPPPPPPPLSQSL